MKNAKLTGSAAILLVHDVVESAHYFRDRLGFTFERFWGDPPDFVILFRDNCRLMLHRAPANHVIVPHWKISSGMWNVYFWVDDADALYAEFQKRGATIDYHIHDKPYGIREFGIQDLDGHDIAFGSPIT
jgi:catechol 2,3-dioxygenase-like lactoylglutathione lyase family enzyme